MSEFELSANCGCFVKHFDCVFENISKVNELAHSKRQLNALSFHIEKCSFQMSIDLQKTGVERRATMNAIHGGVRDKGIADGSLWQCSAQKLSERSPFGLATRPSLSLSLQQEPISMRESPCASMPTSIVEKCNFQKSFDFEKTGVEHRATMNAMHHGLREGGM